MRRTSLLSTFMAMAMCISCTDAVETSKSYYNGVLKQLSSEDMHGRSAYLDGDVLSARVIIDRAREIAGLMPMGQETNADSRIARPEYKSPVLPGGVGRWESQPHSQDYIPYLQNFKLDINVMRGDMSMSVDGKPIRATYDFVAKEFSPSCHGDFKVVEVPQGFLTAENFANYMNSGEFEGCFALVSWKDYLTLECSPFDRYQPFIGKLDPTKISGVLLRDSELFPYFKARTWYTTAVPVFMVTEEAVPAGTKTIRVDMDSEVLRSHDAHNIIAYLPGTEPACEEYITFIAHYDHLGLMGRDNLYPGANDNASGAAMLLTLAKYFSSERPRMGIQFIWLDAEEENLLGAFYYCDNPVLPLENTRMLINLDMIADDGDHLAAECSAEGLAELGKIKAINSSLDKPFDIAMQELSDNSDHYAFALKGVPAAYFSTEGSFYQHYHSPRDSYEKCTDVNFDRLFKLIIGYVLEQ